MTTGTDQIVEPPLRLVICPPLYPDTPDIPETAVESERLAHALESLTAAQTTTASAIEQIALAAVHLTGTLAAFADAAHQSTKGESQ